MDSLVEEKDDKYALEQRQLGKEKALCLDFMIEDQDLVPEEIEAQIEREFTKTSKERYQDYYNS